MTRDAVSSDTMKKNEKNCSTARTICTRSSATSGSTSRETHGLRRSNRDTPFKKSISPASSTRKSERLGKQAPSPASVAKKSGRMEKKKTTSPLGKSDQGKNASSQSSKGSDKSDTNGPNSSDSKKKNNVEGSTNEIKQYKPAMTSRAYKALFRRQPKKSEALVALDASLEQTASPLHHLIHQTCHMKEVQTSSNDKKLLVVAHDGDTDCTPHAYSESPRLIGDDSETGDHMETHGDRPTKSLAKVSHEASIEGVVAPLHHSIHHKGHMEEVNASSTDDQLVAADCFIRLPGGNVDAQESDTNALPHTSSESRTLLVGETILENGTDFPLKLVRDTEEMVLGASFMGASSDENVISPSSANLELQNVLVDETSLETDINLPLKRKRDREGMLDASVTVANGDDHPMSSDGIIPSLSGCKKNTQPEICSRCEKKQKVNHDSGNLRDCSCTAQPGQESDYAAQDRGENGPATSRDYGGKMPNTQQGGSYDGKLYSSMYQEYWVPVQLSNIQVEQYCQNLLSKKLALTTPSKIDPVGGREDALISARKICDHPYVMDSSLQQRLFDKKLGAIEFLNEGINASGKLHLLDAMLTQIKRNGLKAVVFYQLCLTNSVQHVVVGNILEDFVAQRFGDKSYERIERDVQLPKKLTALNNFNMESERFVLLLEMRACNQSIKLLRAEAFILFESSWNPSHEFKLLEKIKIESYSERTRIFRLYSTCTVEEKALILARQNKPVENPSRSLSHVLLMWGASHLFDKLAHFHSNETPDSRVPFEKSIVDGVIDEFSSILSFKGGEKNKGKLSLLLEAKHAQGTYSTDSILFGEENVKSSDEDCPYIFWRKLLSGKNPVWRYGLAPPQRNRKKIRYFEDSEGSAQISGDEITKKRKKAAGNITETPGGIDERKACEKDPDGAAEMPEVSPLLSSPRSASSFSGIFNENSVSGLYSMGSSISGIPEDMLASSGRGQLPYESQKSLNDVLKLEIPKLVTVLHLSECWRRMVEKFLEYVIKNYRVYEEPTTTLQAFQIALIWVAALLVQQKLSHKESIACAKSELAFSCSTEEAEYMYSILYCMKSIFLERTQGLQMDCLGSAAKDVEKTISYIKKKCNKQAQKLLQKHEEKKMELAKMNDEKKKELESRKNLEASLIRIYARTSTQNQADDIKQLDHDYNRKFDELKSEMDECLKSLEKMHEAAKKKLTEDEACWIGRLEIWAQAELSVLVKDSNNKDLREICSSNTSKKAFDTQTFNDADGEATYANSHCVVSKESREAVDFRMPEAENDLGTTTGGSIKQDMVDLRNSKQMDASIMSRQQPKDRVTLAAPNECVSLRVPEMSQSLTNLLRTVSLKLPLSGEEALVTVEINGTSHVGSGANKILDQQNQEACSLEKEMPEGLVLPMKNCDFAASDQADQDICPLSSPAGNQPSPAAIIQDQNTEAATEFNSAESETVETGRFVVSDQDDQVTCLLPSSPAGNQPEPAANMEGQNVKRAAEPRIAWSDVTEIGDTAVSDQDARDTFSLPSSLVGTQPHLAGDIDGQNITTGMQTLTDGSSAVQTGGSAIPDQAAQDASHPPFSSCRNQPDSAVNFEGQNNSIAAEPQTNGTDACEIEIAASAPQVVQSTFANNLGAHESVVQTSAGVTAHVPSLPNNAMAQNTFPPASQIPFPVFTDPFQYELEKMRRESENTRKTYEEKKSIVKAELERKISEIQSEYQIKFQEIDAEYNTRTMEIETNKKLVSMNKLLANAFMCKCTARNAALRGSANASRQLAQVAAQISAQRTYTGISRPATAVTAPVQPQPSVPSIPRPSGGHPNSILCPMPQSRPPPLISNTAPSSSVSPGTNQSGHARVRLPAPHLQPYRSSSIPMARPNPTASLPQGTPTNESSHALPHSTFLNQQQQMPPQQDHSNIGLQGKNDIVCLSDDE